jgi:hypothetical protein
MRVWGNTKTGGSKILGFQITGTSDYVFSNLLLLLRNENLKMLDPSAATEAVFGLLSWSTICCYFTGHKQCKHQDFQWPGSQWIHAKCGI